MKRVKVIRQTAEWYDVPDEVANAMEELQKFVLGQNAKITSLMGISVSMITDISGRYYIIWEWIIKNHPCRWFQSIKICGKYIEKIIQSRQQLVLLGIVG